MIKVCLSLALAVVCVFSTFAQDNPNYSGHDGTTNPAVNLPSSDKTENTVETIQTSTPADDRQEDRTEEMEFQKSGWNALMKANSAPFKSDHPAANKSLGSFTTGDVVIDSYILDSSARHNIDPLLIFAQMSQESSFQKKATSHKGASGLMQLMPATAIRWGVKNIYNPKQNIEAGVKYMRWLLDKFNGDVKLALAAYNAGEGSVKKYGNKIPPYSETINYVKRISAHYDKIKM
ncbi:MAG TPA: lytic transglycosylase domain-containing protein [Pyrinomonadaceae bacterium]|nr:lytic transglycosylase domain-containing protein [Pyrinomonadaceae bacterium]